MLCLGEQLKEFNMSFLKIQWVFPSCYATLTLKNRKIYLKRRRKSPCFFHIYTYFNFLRLFLSKIGPFYAFLNFEIIINSQEFEKNGTESSHVLFTQFPPMAIPYINLVQYQNYIGNWHQYNPRILFRFHQVYMLQLFREHGSNRLECMVCIVVFQFSLSHAIT